MEKVIFFAHLSSLSAIIPMGVGFYRLRSLTKAGRFILTLVVISALSDFTAFQLLTRGHTTWPLFNVFYILQFVLFYKVFEELKINLLRFMSVVFVLFSIVNFIWLQRPEVFNTYTSYLGGLLLISFALIYLYRLIRDTPVERIQDLPMMWICFGVFTYFGGTMFLFLFNNVLVYYQPSDHQMIWILHNLFNLLKNLLFAVGLWKSYRAKV